MIGRLSSSGQLLYIVSVFSLECEDAFGETKVINQLDINQLYPT